jgi:hypothetical protein
LHAETEEAYAKRGKTPICTMHAVQLNWRANQLSKVLTQLRSWPSGDFCSQITLGERWRCNFKSCAPYVHTV